MIKSLVKVLVAVLIEVQDRDARARPDAVDEPVRKRSGRIAARRSETGRERRIVEAWPRLDSVSF